MLATTGEYYVRDEGGNILATYRSSSTSFSKDLLCGILVSLKRDAPLAMFDSFIAHDLAPNSGFVDLFEQNIIDKFPSWADSLTEAPLVSWYAQQDPMVINGIFASTDQWMDDMRTFSTTSALYDSIYSGPLAQVCTGGVGAQTTTLLFESLNLASPSPGPADELLTMYDFAVGFPTVTGTWTTAGVFYIPPPPPYNPTNISNLVSALSMNPGIIPPVANNMASDIAGMSYPDAMNFWHTYMSNNTIFYDPSLLSFSSAWENALTNAILSNGDPSLIGDFLDYWSNARSWLNATTTINYRLNKIYNTSADSLISNYIARDDSSAYHFGEMVFSMSMTMRDLINLIRNSSSGIGLYYNTSVTPYVTAGISDTLELAEHHIYGSSRLGMQTYDSATTLRNVYDYFDTTQSVSPLNRRVPWYSYGYNELIDSTQTEPWGHGDVSEGIKADRTVGLRYYELADHLGNVLATVLDRKTGVKANPTDTTYSYWKADIASVTDYYPFGMEMPGRTFTLAGISGKFGFNGQMKDDEIAGKGNHNTALFWEYDTRLGRRWNLDPKPTIGVSDYATNGNNPVLNFDFLGDKLTVSSDPQARQDIGGLMGAHSDAISYNSMGEANINYDKLAGQFKDGDGNLDAPSFFKYLADDKGFNLAKNLIDDKQSFYYGTEAKFDAMFMDPADAKWSVGTIDRSPVRGSVTNSENENSWFTNLSTTAYDGKGGRQFKPAGGYDGAVRIQKGTIYTLGRETPRVSFVFHELAENFYRTHFKLPYVDAHAKAVISEGNSFGNPNPGDFTKFIFSIR